LLPKRIHVKDVVRAVARRYGYSEDELLSVRRKRALALQRQVGMYIARTLTGRSFEYIGTHFGGRTHCTVRYAFLKIKRLRGEHAPLATLIEEVSGGLGAP
jgi:chromosomal replication initiator protein